MREQIPAEGNYAKLPGTDTVLQEKRYRLFSPIKP